ncbi:SPOSA6832_02081 [Sporobolomyces salmonicolor]|uniref:SPOSA6832_02081-mRNA-1:cds n=1 Tax=Sporidiobolus salmonicolor TaxID=5005 RepID=A0A0D6EL37_SPOSA|nr:SPOSA6832_02081 [Sporobolomyces salmonicolor]
MTLSERSAHRLGSAGRTLQRINKGSEQPILSRSATSLDLDQSKSPRLASAMHDDPSPSPSQYEPNRRRPNPLNRLPPPPSPESPAPTNVSPNSSETSSVSFPFPMTRINALRGRFHRPTRRSRILLSLILALATLLALYEFSTPFRHGVIAAQRCATIAWAVSMAVVDYKLLFRKTWPATEEGRKQRHQDYESTHWRAASRLMEALRSLGGIYIKLGQHLSTVQLVPLPWSLAMKPLQDQCFPTPVEDLQELFLSDVGAPMSRFFSSFDEEPIGVASLAQVHRAVDRETGKMVAVKCMHPDLEEHVSLLLLLC